MFSMSTRKLLLAHWLVLSSVISTATLIFPLYLNSLGFAPDLIGDIIGVGTLLAYFGLAPMYLHSDRIGRKTYLVIAVLLFVLSVPLILVMPRFIPVLIASILLMKLAGRTPWDFGKMISLEHYENQKGRSYGLFGVALVLGSLIGSLFGGQAVDSIGFQLTLVLCAFGAILSMVFLKPLKDTKYEMNHSKLNINRKFIGYTAQRFLSGITFGGVFTFALPLFLANHMQLSIGLVGIVNAVMLAGQVAGFGLGAISDKYDFRVIGPVTLFVSSLLTLALAFFTNAAQLLIFSLILFAGSLVQSLSATTMPACIKTFCSKLGRDISIVETMSIMFGNSVGAFLVGQIILTVGYPPVFSFGAIFFAMAAAILTYTFMMDKGG